MKKEYVLTTANIDHISEDIDAFLKNQKQVKENKIRARLSAETALLRWLEKGYEGHKVLVDCFVRFGRPILRLMLTGASFNPLEVEEEEENYFAIIQENLACVTTFRKLFIAFNLSCQFSKLPPSSDLFTGLSLQYANRLY